MPRALLALLALCLTPVGCTTTAQADTDQPKSTSKSTTTGNTSDAEPEPADTDTTSDEPTPDRAPTDTAALPDCPSEIDNRSVHVNYCTDDGRLAGAWKPVDTLKVPDEVEIIFNAESPDTTGEPSLMIAVRGDELFIRHVSCGACRRVMGQGFAGDLAHMSAEQIVALQAQLGLGKDVEALDSGEKWASYANDAAGKAALTELSRQTRGANASDGR